MRRLIIAVGVVAGVIGATIVGLVAFVSPEDVKNEIIRQVRNNSGWNLRIDGAIDVGLWPGINLAASDVGLSGRAWADGLEFVAADKVSFGLAIWPLLGGSVNVTGIRLENPVIELEIDRLGRTSWDPVDLPADGPPPTSIEEAIGQSDQPANAPTPSVSADSNQETAAQTEEAAPAATPSGSSLPIRNLTISNLEIIDGSLSYLDRRSGEAEALDTINIRARVPSLDSRSTITGSAVWRGEEVAIDARIEKLRALIENAVSDVAIDLETARASASVEGQVSAEGQTLFAGKVAAATPSVPALLNWATGASDGVPEIGPVSVATPLLVQADRVSAEDVALSIGTSKGNGSVDFNLAGTRPKLVSRFSLDRLDVDAFIKADAGTQLDEPMWGNHLPLVRASFDRSIVVAQVAIPRANPRRQAGAQAAPAAPAATDNQPAGDAAETPIDFEPLRSVDADLDLSFGEIVASGLTARGVALTAVLDAGRLAVDLAEADLFGGGAGGEFVLDASKPVPSLDGALKAASLNLGSLARLGGYEDPVEGALSADVAFTSSGRSSTEFLGALDAQGSVSVRDGLLDGLPLAEPLADPSAARVTNVSADLTFTGRNAPIAAGASADWRGETFRAKASLTPAPLASGQPAPISATVQSTRVSAGYDGTLAPSGKAGGVVSLSTPSLRDLIVWLNQAAPEIGGLGPFGFKGRLDATADTIAFNNATISLDQSSASGSGRVELSGAVPSVQANLAFSTLDLTPYLVPEGAGPSPDPSWSREPMDFSGLQSVNANLSLTAQTILADQIRVGPASVAATVQGGVLAAQLTQLALYGGSGDAAFELNGAGSRPALKARGTFKDIDAYPFLRDAVEFDKLEGTGNLRFDIRSAGANEADMVQAVNGYAAFQFWDGAIRGINIPRMMRGLSTDILNGWQQSSAEKTDFSSFSASFNITDGVVANEDLSLVGPFVRVAGKGLTSLPPKTLAWRVEPEVVGTTLGQGRTGEFTGFGVPVVVEGPWESPRIYPDIAGILQNPGSAYDQLRALGGGIFKKIDPLGGGSAEAAQDQVKQRIQEQTGVNVDEIIQEGKIDKDKAVDEAVKGIISIFGDRE
ncbi:MAG: AsmA family protein [Pseudomonadota bacterium]